MSIVSAKKTSAVAPMSSDAERVKVARAAQRAWGKKDGNVLPELRKLRKEWDKNPLEKRAVQVSERVAASLCLFNPEFVRSIARAEKDYRLGRTRKISSLKELGKK